MPANQPPAACCCPPKFNLAEESGSSPAPLPRLTRVPLSRRYRPGSAPTVRNVWFLLSFQKPKHGICVLPSFLPKNKTWNMCASFFPSENQNMECVWFLLSFQKTKHAHQPPPGPCLLLPAAACYCLLLPAQAQRGVRVGSDCGVDSHQRGPADPRVAGGAAGRPPGAAHRRGRLLHRQLLPSFQPSQGVLQRGRSRREAVGAARPAGGHLAVQPTLPIRTPLSL
eukprot:352767-Chlamydomonas_euryale.AAC.4